MCFLPCSKRQWIRWTAFLDSNFNELLFHVSMPVHFDRKIPLTYNLCRYPSIQGVMLVKRIPVRMALRMHDIMKRQSRLIIFVLIVLSVLLTIALGLLGSAIELPSALKPIAFPLFLCVAFILCLIAVYQYFVEKRIEQTVSPLSGQNRQRLIAKVRAFWITGFLEQSLHDAALVALKEENMQVFSKLIEKLNWLKVNGFFLGIKTPEWWRAYAIPLIVRYVEHSTETHWHNTLDPPYG